MLIGQAQCPAQKFVITISAFCLMDPTHSHFTILSTAGKSFQHAADFFLQAALLGDGGVADAVAFDARIAAASNMVRAGLKDDARAQLDWLQKNVKESEKLEIIRRERQKL